MKNVLKRYTGLSIVAFPSFSILEGGPRPHVSANVRMCIPLVACTIEKETLRGTHL